MNFRIHVRRLVNGYEWDENLRVADNEGILDVARRTWGDGYVVTTDGESVPPVVFQGVDYTWARGEPRCYLDVRDSIIAWLVWNSRDNGCYTDEDCDSEGMPRLTLETAQEALKEAYYQSTGLEIDL